MADAEIVPASRVGARDVSVPKVDGPACRRAKTGQDLRKLGLTVSFDAGDSNDLPFANVEVDAPDRRQASIVLGSQAAHLQDRRAGGRCVLGDAEHNVPAHHEPGQLLLVRRRRFYLADHPAAAHDRYPVRNPQHLLQLVGDEHHGAALVCQMAQDVEKLLDLGRNEHRSRLVENQDFRTTIERLQNFDPLHRADRQVANPRIELGVESVSRPDIADRSDGGSAVDNSEPSRCMAQHDVFEHRQRRRKHEMLMHHADVQRYGIVRVPDRDRLGLNSYFA